MHDFAVTNPAPLQASTKVNATISQVHAGEMMKKESLGWTSSAEQFYLPNATPMHLWTEETFKITLWIKENPHDWSNKLQRQQSSDEGEI